MEGFFVIRFDSSAKLKFGDPAAERNYVIFLDETNYVAINRGRPLPVIPITWREGGDYDPAYKLGEGVSQYNVDAFGISLVGRAILAYLKGGGRWTRSLLRHLIKIPIRDQQHYQPQLALDPRACS